MGRRARQKRQAERDVLFGRRAASVPEPRGYKLQFADGEWRYGAFGELVDLLASRVPFAVAEKTLDGYAVFAGWWAAWGSDRRVYAWLRRQR